MKLNPRKTIMKAIRVAGVNDFKSNEEMLMAKALYDKMVEGNKEADPAYRRRKKKAGALYDKLVATPGPTLAENA